ncbi:MAG: DUF885 domain-containing protein [Alphaproteobacteria bacterium]|nr:DUF885 domain-containing protein [Alphaproteobacteria bacterium]
MLLFSVAAAALTVPLHAQTVAVASGAIVPAPTPDSALAKLFADSDADYLRRNPTEALARGDLSHADTLGDLFSNAATEANYRAAIHDLEALRKIDRAALTPTDQIAYDVFKWQRTIDMRGASPELRALQDVRPIDHFLGIQTWYPDLASGQGNAPFKTVKDYEDNIARHHAFAQQIDVAISRFREGVASGVVQPKLTVERTIEQLDLMLKDGPEKSPFALPLAHFPHSISAAEQARLKPATMAAIKEDVFPAYRKLRTYLHDDYLPHARSGPGLVYMKGGKALYAYDIEQNTTLPLTADAVHQTGLNEVARITKAMEIIKNKVGFKGNLHAFFEYMRTAKRFQPQSAQWLHDTYVSIGARIEKRIPEQFALIPKTPLEIRPDPPYREKTSAGGEYDQGTPDGSRPGVFYYNTYDLPVRYTYGMETLFLHEAIPGHHFQISLAQENTALPNFMRFGGNTAFAEGWALYSESLWHELGMETDPYQRFGGLNDEMLRAMRLVVDTGIHAKGWSREQAIDYMLSHSSMSKTDVVAEVERYIAWPAQALAYKTGQMTIQRLKDKARAALGAKFDPRKFHAQVLNTGALPLAVLEEKIDAWIKDGGQ